ncbi:MAG: hypothetical protein AB7S46_12705, partial [Flavobacteriaceae bacterium]
MTTIHLHIGNPKTGTTFMQAVLRKNAARLAGHGIAYPVETGPELTDSSITSGNGSFLIREEARRRTFLQAQNPDVDLLISSELLASEIAESGQFGAFMTDARSLGFDRFSVLLLLRDPIEYAASAFQQNIKRNGIDYDLVEHFDAFARLERTLNALKKLNAHPDVELRVLNYGNWRRRLAEVLRDWLSLPFELEQPQVEIINRGLTRSELNLQRILNTQLGPSGYVLADRFCEDLPDIAAEIEYPPLDVQQRFIERVAPLAEEINALIPAGEKLKMTFIEPTTSPAGNDF